MAIHSSVLAWRIPGTAEPGGLSSIGSQSQTRLKRLSNSSSSSSSSSSECKSPSNNTRPLLPFHFCNSCHLSISYNHLTHYCYHFKQLSFGSVKNTKSQTSFILPFFMQIQVSDVIFLFPEELFFNIICKATPVFLPGESQGWGCLMGCRLWGRTELDMTEATQQQQQQQGSSARCQLSFCLSENGFISPSFLKEILLTIEFQVGSFFLSTLYLQHTFCLHGFWSKVCSNSYQCSTLGKMFPPTFSFWFLSRFSLCLFFFCSFNICLDVNYLVFILLNWCSLSYLDLWFGGCH